jgi:hypothetical protein
MAGYSKTPLVQKLGIKPGHKIVLLNAPHHYMDALGSLLGDVQVERELAGPCDLIQFFATRRAALEEQFPALKAALAPAGALWIAWPKRSAKVPTDLDENIIRAIGLAHGLVDVKVIAVDEVWSGLRFVYRLADRPQVGQA